MGVVFLAKIVNGMDLFFGQGVFKKYFVFF